MSLLLAILLTLAPAAEDNPRFHPCWHGNHVGHDAAGQWWDCTHLFPKEDHAPRPHAASVDAAGR